METKIPLKLFTFYHDVNKMSENMKLNYDKMVSENSEFNVEIFDIKTGREFIETHFNNDVLEAYDTLKPYSYKSDLFRFCHLYINGGIYVDIKYESVNNFRFIELTDKEYLVSEPLGVQTCLIVLNKNNLIMKNCIETLKTNTLARYYGNSPLITGPLLISNEFSKLNNAEINTDLAWKMINHKQHIFRDDLPILVQYNQYREDLLNKSDQPHYNEMYWNNNIYN